MNRRRFIEVVAGAAGVAAAHRAEARPEERLIQFGRFKAVVFDGFVIFDPKTIEQRVREHVPDKAEAFVNLWRTRQFEYTWLRTVGTRYVDFWRITEDALQFTAKSLRVSLNSAQHDALMDAYCHLRAWPDAGAALAELRQMGVRLAFLSNFTARMLDANSRATGLSELFEPHLTADRIREYKPSPRAYQMALDAFGLHRHEIAFAAFAGWDAAGASGSAIQLLG